MREREGGEREKWGREREVEEGERQRHRRHYVGTATSINLLILADHTTSSGKHRRQQWHTHTRTQLWEEGELASDDVLRHPSQVSSQA